MPMTRGSGDLELPRGTSLTSLTGLIVRPRSSRSLSASPIGCPGCGDKVAVSESDDDVTIDGDHDEETVGINRTECDLNDDLMHSESDDEVIGYSARLFVFAAFSLGVQGFMSYSGGATPASLPAIQKSNPGMSQIELSLLGSLDKIGQVVASPLWGRAMQRCPTKVLLSSGLFLNSLFSLQFGFVQSKYAMFLSKFMQGCTESQQVVWGNLWTTAWAPRHLLSTWMNLGGVAAGVGTAVGQAVAGFGITAGLPYSFAYTVQAVALGLLWIGLVFTPRRCIALPSNLLVLPTHTEATAKSERQDGAPTPARSLGAPSTPGSRSAGGASRGERSHVGSGSGHRRGRAAAPSVRAQLVVLLQRRLYWLTMLCVAENNFIVGGLQFFWTRFFCNGPWTLDLGTVTAAGLLVQGVGMGLGILFGPIIVNRYGGYDDDLGRYVTLHLLMRFSAVATFGSGLAVLAMGIQLSSWTPGADLLDSSLRNPWLWTFWFATVPINFALSAQGGVQTVINIGSVPPGMQEFAQGVTTSVQFLCGYAGGVILPSVILDVAAWLSFATAGYKMTEADQLATGVLVLMMMCPALFVTVAIACKEARRIWQRSLESDVAGMPSAARANADEGHGEEPG